MKSVEFSLVNETIEVKPEVLECFIDKDVFEDIIKNDYLSIYASLNMQSIDKALLEEISYKTKRMKNKDKIVKVFIDVLDNKQQLLIFGINKTGDREILLYSYVGSEEYSTSYLKGLLWWNTIQKFKIA